MGRPDALSRRPEFASEREGDLEAVRRQVLLPPSHFHLSTLSTSTPFKLLDDIKKATAIDPLA